MRTDTTENQRPDIRAMFDRISPRYDLLNRLISFGLDLRWRKRAVVLLGELHGKTVLDLCCGSGDFIAIIRKMYGENVTTIGVDFARNMLTIADRRFTPASSGQLLLCQGDALRIPLADESVDAVTIGFGIRNIADKPAAFAEILRILKPGGQLVMLEPAWPKNRIVRRLFAFYFKYVMGVVGGLISGDFAAYRYLHDSVLDFPELDAFVALMTASGFIDAKALPLTMGTAIVYWGGKI